MAGRSRLLRQRDISTVQAAADALLSSPRFVNPETRRGSAGAPGRLLAEFGASPLAEVSGEELAGMLEHLWGAPATWSRDRGVRHAGLVTVT